MNATLDQKRRLVLPRPALPGETYSVSQVGRGQFLLVKLEAPAASRSRLVKEGTETVIVAGRRVSADDLRRHLEECI